jgi:hypothetical protein
MNRHNFINGIAVHDLNGTWVLSREADALLKKRNGVIKGLNKKISNLKRQLKRRRKEYKLRSKKPFHGRVKLIIQVSSNRTYSMYSKALMKRL